MFLTSARPARVHRRHRARRAACAAAAWALVACSSPSAPPLRVGLNPWPGYEVLSLAEDLRLYDAEGVEVRLIAFSSLADERRAFERGQIDVMAATAIEVMQARDHSPRTPQIVQVVDYSSGADIVLARRRFASVAALRGARIGVELASLGVYILSRALAKHGLAIGDVSVVSSDQLSMDAAFRAGDLDAIVTYPPTSVRLLRDADAHTVFSTREIPDEVIDVLAVERELIEQRPDQIARFLRAYHRGLAYTADHPDEAYRLMAAHEGITPAEFKATLTDGITMVSPAQQASYLAPGGALEPIVTEVDRILRATHQITGADRRAGVISHRFIAP